LEWGESQPHPATHLVSVRRLSRGGNLTSLLRNGCVAESSARADESQLLPSQAALDVTAPSRGGTCEPTPSLWIQASAGRRMPDMLPAMLAGSIRPAVPVLVVAALVGAPELVGCTGSDPKPATISTPPTPASSTPSVTSPAQQVEAAVRAYYAELTHAAQTNDTSVLKTLTTKGCPCYRPVRVIDRNAERGYQTPDASFNVVGIEVHDVEPKNAAAQVRTSEAPYDVIDRSDKTIGHVSARRSFLDLSLVQAPDGKWIIANQFDLRGSG
jgi:hypothetical protein